MNEAYGVVLDEFPVFLRHREQLLHACERGVLAVKGNDRGGASGYLAADPSAIRAHSTALFFAPRG